MPIRHSFPDDLPDPATVRCYSFDEVFAEKIRAMGERGRPRDLYDIINLYRHRGLGQAPETIATVLVEKCETKGVPVPTATSVLADPATAEDLESEWENMLAHQLPSLPPLAFYLDELENLFSWLNGELELEELPPAPSPPGATDAAWTPPPLVSTWGGLPVETIRFAAANLLLIKIGYKGGHRIVEPYSLRRSAAGHFLLMAQRPEEPHIKAYRMDRMGDVEVQREVFVPRYPVEFAPDGAISARPVQSTAGVRRLSSSTRSQLPYAVRCPRCDRVFGRKTRGLALRPHKDSLGFDCSGRRGYREY